MNMSANARALFVALIGAPLFFALGRFTSDEPAPRRAARDEALAATVVPPASNSELAPSSTPLASSLRAAVEPEAQPESASDSESVPAALDEQSAIEAARLAAFLEQYRTTFELDDRNLASSSLSWSEAKLAIGPEFELTHERAERLRDYAYDFDHTPSPDGEWYEFGLDARERSASRIIGAVGGFVGAYPLAPDAAERALAIVHAHRARISPLVEEALDLYEQSLIDAWRDELYPIWREGEAFPGRRERDENGRLPRESFAGGAFGWKFEFAFDSIDHPQLEAALAEIEALKIACVAEISLLGS